MEEEKEEGSGVGRGRSSELTGKMQIGPVGASKLHLTPHWLPRLCAAAPAGRLPLWLAKAWGPKAAWGRRPRAPLIGRVAPLITLFRLNGQRLKETAAAGRAQRVGGG